MLRGMRSRMMGDYHVRFCEGLGGRFPWATRRFVLVAQSQIPLQMQLSKALEQYGGCAENLLEVVPLVSDLDITEEQERRWNEGLVKLRSGCMADAQAIFEKLAEEGVITAYSQVAFFYETGEGDAVKDLDVARYWYDKAAEQLDPEGILGLARFYYLGRGVEINYERAYQIYKEMTKLNDPIAYFVLGEMYHLGRGVSKDIEKAVEYYNKSSEQGNIHAKLQLATIEYEKRKSLINFIKIRFLPILTIFIFRRNKHDSRIRTY